MGSGRRVRVWERDQVALDAGEVLIHSPQLFLGFGYFLTDHLHLGLLLQSLNVALFLV